MSSEAVRSSAVTEAAALGLQVLAETVARTRAGITVVDADRRYVYANPAACEMLGHPLDWLRGRDLLGSFPVRERATILAHLEQHNDEGALFDCTMLDADRGEHEIVYSTLPMDVAGRPHSVGILRDVSAARTAARAAMALAQTAAQMVGAITTDDILTKVAHHAVAGTRALACGIDVVSDGEVVSAGGSGFPFYPSKTGQSGIRSRVARSAGQISAADFTDGAIKIGDVPGKPVLLPDARGLWSANPATEAFVATLDGLDWQGAACVPLSWQNRVFGLLVVYLPRWMDGPNEVEMAFYTALADQAAIVVTNAQLAAQAAQAATVLERARLARDLHDSVSQALFSMTMHTRAAQLTMAKHGVDESGALGRSIVELAELTRGAMAEMRALIFELRPAALAEEGLVAALRKQSAALTAREQIVITVQGPAERLVLDADVEEHLYRIMSEALHNVVKHAGARTADVTVAIQAGRLLVQVSDDGVGFDTGAEHPGHLGLCTMVERAAAVNAELILTSAIGRGTTVTVSLPDGGRRNGKESPDAR